MTHATRIGCQFGPFKGQAAFLDTARQLEDNGFAVATMPDHFGGWASVWPSIVAAGAVTTTLRLGPLTINNDLWNPMVLARDIVSTDHLTGGRLEVGIGAGWRNDDYSWTGLQQDAGGVRVRRLAESIGLRRQLFAPGDVSHAGEFYRAEVPSTRLMPAQAGGPPIFVGGGGRHVLRLAAQQADIVGVHINLKGGQFRIGTGADDADQGVVADDVQQRLAWIASDQPADRRQPLQLFFMEVRAGSSAAAAADEVAPTFGVDAAEVLASPYFLTGSPEEMAQKISTITERYGITYFTCREDHIPVMSKVIPLLPG